MGETPTLTQRLDLAAKTFQPNSYLGRLLHDAAKDRAALRAALEEIANRAETYINNLSDHGSADPRTISSLGHLCNAHKAARRALEES